MNALQGLRSFVAMDAASETNGGVLTSNSIDTKDYDYLLLLVNATTAGTNKYPAISVEQSDTDTASLYAPIAAASFATQTSTSASNISPSPESATNTYRKDYLQIGVDLRGKKRFVRVTVTPTTTQTYTIKAVLGKAKQAPDSVAERNVCGYAFA